MSQFSFLQLFVYIVAVNGSIFVCDVPSMDTWLRILDSNQYRQSQSLLCYLYTNPQYKSRRIYFDPEAGLEPAIALLLGKCLNHLNYSGSKDCCSRLIILK